MWVHEWMLIVFNYGWYIFIIIIIIIIGISYNVYDIDVSLFPSIWRFKKQLGFSPKYSFDCTLCIHCHKKKDYFFKTTIFVSIMKWSIDRLLFVVNLSVLSWWEHIKHLDVSSIFSAILWRSLLLVEESRVPGEYHRPVVRHWHALSHNVVSSAPPH